MTAPFIVAQVLSIVRAAVAAAALVLGLAPLPSRAAAATDASGHPRPIRSIRELRYENVVRQKWDLSCGAAALSALLTYDLGDPVSEERVVTWILRRSDPVKVRARGGFSLLDLKRAASARGYEANGYLGMTLSGLVRIAPAIVPTVIDGYDHFVVFRGIRAGHVVLADPAYGNRTLPVERFEASWPKRIAFVVRRPGTSGGARVEPAPVLLVPPSVIRNALPGGR